MAQKATSEQARRFKHFSFEIRQNGAPYSFYTFLINPEEFEQTEKARAVIVQTLGSAYIDKYGLGLPEFHLSGTTGFHEREVPGGGKTDGYERFHGLRTNVFRQFFGEPDDAHWQMYFYQWEDNEFWEVFPVQFDLKRSKSRPLLYMYDIRLTGLRRLGTPLSADARAHNQNVDKISANVNSPKAQASRVTTGLDDTLERIRLNIVARDETPATWKVAYGSFGYVATFTDTEVFNEVNYPGTNAVMTDLNDVYAKLGAFQVKAGKYATGKEEHINMLRAELNAVVTKAKAVLTRLEALAHRPILVTTPLQEAIRWAGIMLAYPDSFKARA